MVVKFPARRLILALGTLAMLGCESSESDVLFAQCETYVEVRTGWCTRCTNQTSEVCEAQARGGSRFNSTFCIGKRPQADTIETNFFVDCLQPLDANMCMAGLPQACLLIYDDELAEMQEERS